MSSFHQYKESYEEGKTLPQNFYTDETVFTDEMKRIYFKQWLMVDHISRIESPGDYFVFEAEKESIIIIRGRDNEIRAFYNVCTHRGSRICLDEEGSKNKFEEDLLREFLRRTLSKPIKWSYHKVFNFDFSKHVNSKLHQLLNNYLNRVCYRNELTFRLAINQLNAMSSYRSR